MKPKPKIRDIIHEIMEPYAGRRYSTRLSLYVDIFILICIVASCVVIPIEVFYPGYETFYKYLEFCFAIIFIVEYLLRWYSAANRLSYPFTFYAIIDLLAIIPSILMMATEFMLLRSFRGIRLLRFLRFLRILRMLKFIRYSYLIYRGWISFRIWFSAICDQYRLRQLGSLFVWLLILWVFGSNLLFFTEKWISGVEGPYSGYWQAYWHILIVLISGIEDKEPLSLLGRIEVTVFLIGGIIVVGMLTGEIVSILVRKIQRAGKLTLKPPEGKMEQHIVILGDNGHRNNVIKQVNAALSGKYFFLVVSPNADEIKVTDKEGFDNVFALAGDPLKSEVLDASDVDDSLRVVILANHGSNEDISLNDNRSLMIALAVASRMKDIPMVVELRTADSLRYARNLAGVDFLVSRHFIERMASQAILNPGVTYIYNELMTFTGDSSEFYSVPVPNELIGKTFKDAQLYFLEMDNEAVVLVGIDCSPEEDPNTHFWLNPVDSQDQLPPSDIVLSQGDNLIVIAYERPAIVGVEEEDLWSGKILQRD